LHKLVAFSIGGALAGLAGCLFTAWGNFVSPTAFSVAQSAQIIIWLMVGGAGTLLGPVIGAIVLSWLTLKIGTQQTVNANVVLGAILLVFVVLVPKGVAPMITERLVPWLLSLRQPAASPRSVAREGKA
jgi:branched-chain amino acid transport system permease protein